MSDSKDKQVNPDDPHSSERIHIILRSVSGSRVFSIRGDCTIRQLKRCLSERLRAPAEQLELSHSGLVLRESELMGHLKEQGGSVSLSLIRRPEPSSVGTSSDPASEPVRSELKALSDPDPITPTPTSPLLLVDGLESLGMENSRSHHSTALQSQVESQLVSDPESMPCVLASPLVQNTPFTSSPRLTTQLVLSDPVINQSPTFPLLTTSCESHQGPAGPTSPTPPLSTGSTDPLRGLASPPGADSGFQSTLTAGMQSLLEEIAASPGLMESLLSGPHISSLLHCLTQNPDFAAQMLLSHPLFSGNVQLQEQMRQQIPLFLQQMQSPELLSMLLNPRAMDALLQIQQGLQTLAVEAPSIMPVSAGPGTSVGAGLHGARLSSPDPDLNSQSGCGPQEVSLTQQQQHFVHQMLMALTNTNNGVGHEDEEDFQEELQQLSSMGFRDRQANLQALLSTGGDLPSALQLLSP